jgi:predicted RecA/RadA family phage recombinase
MSADARLRCALSETKSITVTAASPGVTAGTMAKVKDVVGVYLEDADTGDEVAFCYYAPKIVVTSVAVGTGKFTAGSKVYFDATGKKITESSTGNTLCGVVLETPALAAKEVLIDLDGTLGIVA